MGILKPKELSKLGYTDNTARSIAVELIAKHCKHTTPDEIKNILMDIHERPQEYKNNQIWSKLAAVISLTEVEVSHFNLRDTPIHYYIYGEDGIDELSKKQMDMAMRLPVTVSGALMPDGCAGYGLPIGGVLATTEDVVIPYAVGKDIGCRMSLTILDADDKYLEKYHDRAVAEQSKH